MGVPLQHPGISSVHIDAGDFCVLDDVSMITLFERCKNIAIHIAYRQDCCSRDRGGGVLEKKKNIPWCDVP